MGWLDKINAKKKDEVPAMFKDKSDDDILKMLQEASKDKQRVGELEARVAEQDSTVATIKTEFAAVKERLVAAEARATPPPRKEEDDGSNDDFVTNPDGSFGKRIGPYANLTIQTSALTARMLAQQQLNNQDLASNGKTMDGRLFQAWSTEIDSESKKYPAIQLTKTEAWIGIYLYLKGLHADELRDPEIRKKKYNFLEPAATSQGTRQADEPKKEGAESLTDAEKHVADKMHVSYADYAKRKAAMQMSA